MTEPQSDSRILHFLKCLNRKKRLPADILDTSLSRCLTTFDVTFLGIGHMIGGGIYVLTGQVARNITGPAIVISFVVAGIASVLSALCYAEFGTWIPKAGSAYTYTYVSIGEIWAFVIGWNIILEHLIGIAAVARTWSAYVDSMTNGWIHNTTHDAMPLTFGNDSDVALREIVSDTPDFLALAVLIVLSIIIACGAKCSTRFNSVFASLNLSVVAFIVGFGLWFADYRNWSSDFIPFGWASIIAGSSRCFFAFLGFDSIATAAEESTTPSKTIPRATLISLLVVSVSYILMSSTLTLMQPYQTIFPDSAFAYAFEYNGVMWAKYVISFGAMCAITTSITGHLFSLPRVLYSMADDGLLFSCFAYINETTKVPSLSIMATGLIAGVISMFVNLDVLIDLLSIGTLLAFTIVAASVIIIRYRDSSNLMASSSISYAIVAFIVFSASHHVMLNPATEYYHNSIVKAAAVINGGILIFCAGFIATKEETDCHGGYQVPCVPFLPCASIYINIMMMVSLNAYTWVRLAVWLGFVSGTVRNALAIRAWISTWWSLIQLMAMGHSEIKI